MKSALNQKLCALVGVGYWGKHIFRNLYELGCLYAACDSNSQHLAAFKDKFPDVHYTASFEEMLSSDKIRAVVIATPAATHFELVKKALIAQKDVFVEKPLALTVREGEDLVALAKSSQRILMVGHILQYHPAVQTLKELIGKGELGKIRYIYSNRLNIGKLRTEENILWSFAPHDISVILMLMSEEPVRISSFSGDYLNKGISDVTLTMLEFRNGVKAHIFVSWLHPFKEQKLIVVGSKAMAVFDDISKDKLVLYPHTIDWKYGKVPVAQKADFKVIPTLGDEPLRLELQHFVDCIITRSSPRTDGEEGLRVLRVLECAEQPTTRVATSYSVHPSAHVDENVAIGAGTKVWHFSHVLKNSVIGKNCVIGQNVAIGPEVVIGNGCKIQNNVSIYKGVKLEDGVFCGPSCVFTNVYNPRAYIERKNEFKDTLVKQGATIGANATIVCPSTIGRFAFVGAGAVVKYDVPDYGLVVGVPARQIGWVCKCGASLPRFSKKKIACAACKSEYRLLSKKLIPVKETL